MQKLGSARLDRAAGVLLGQACGDALGVPYEFNPPMPADERAFMKGSGVFGPGEWSDDTEMALCIASVVATAPRPLRDEDLDHIAQRFLGWSMGSGREASWARDVGIQTSSVLGTASVASGPMADACHRAAVAYNESTGKPGAGNGALMRTGILALVCPFDRDATAELVRRGAGLTHVAPDVEDTCVLWTEAVRSVMLRDWGADEALAPEHLLAGLDLIPQERRPKWEQIIEDATGADPASNGHNGWTVKTFQVAWAAITSTPVPALDPAAGSFPCQHLQRALDATVHAGWDTDTSAAVAGQLLGARWGASAVPAKWLRGIRGRGLREDGTHDPSMRARDLVRLAVMTIKAGVGSPVPAGEWPRCARVSYPWASTPEEALTHPADEQARIGGMASLEHGCDAAVSACRVGREEPLLAGIAQDDRIELLLIDDDTVLKNPNLHFVIDEGARAACQLRHEGRRVLIHCVNAESRSPSVAARYGVLRGGTADESRREVQAALDAWRGPRDPTPRLWEAVGDLGENRVGCDQCPYRDGETPVAADGSVFHPCV
jgi:ADP-ribosyl-[dinitrogen reductase] hydrolase